MRLLKQLAICFVLCTLYLVFLPLPAHAQTPCNFPPDFVGPTFTTLFSKLANDCAVPPKGSPLWQDFLNKAIVVPAGRPELFAALKGNPALIQKQGNGTTTLNISSYGNIAVGSAALKSDPQTILPNLPAVSMTGADDTARFTAECTQIHETDLDVCATKLGLALPTADGGSRQNELVASTQYQRTHTLEEQLNDKQDRAKNVLRCTGDANDYQKEHCDNYYVATDNNTKSIPFASAILAIPNIRALLNLPVKQQQEAMALEDSKAAEPIYLVLLPAADTSKCTNIVSCLFQIIAYNISPPQPQILEWAIHGLPHIVQSSQNKAAQYLPLNDGQKALSRLNQSPGQPADNTLEPDKQIIQKAKNSQDVCVNLPTTPTQFLGSIAPSLAPRPIIVTWLFNIIDSIEAATKNPLIVWKACLIEPFELYQIDQVSAKDTAATERKFYPLGTAGFDQDVGIPQPILNATSGNTDLPGSTSYTPPQPGACTGDDTYDDKTKLCTHHPDDQLTYSAGDIGTILMGGSQAHASDLSDKHRAFMPLSSDNYFNKSCYYQNLPASLLTALAIPAGFSSAQCPEPLSSSTLGKASGSTGTCDFPDESSVNAAIDQATQKYHIPAGMLRAIFEIESYGWIARYWHGNQNAPAYSCTGPEAKNGATAMGIMQITDSAYKLTTCGKGLSNDIGVCSSNGENLSRCNVNDSVELAARLLLVKLGMWNNSTCQATGSFSSKTDIYNSACSYYGSWSPDTATANFGVRPDGLPYNYCDIVCSKMGICPPFPAQGKQL